MGISLAARHFSNVDLPHPFLPRSPYRPPWFSSMIVSSTSTFPWRAREKALILMSLARGSEMRAPVALLPPSSASTSRVQFFKTASRSSVLLLALDSAYSIINIIVSAESVSGEKWVCLNEEFTHFLGFRLEICFGALFRRSGKFWWHDWITLRQKWKDNPTQTPKLTKLTERSGGRCCLTKR